MSLSPPRDIQDGCLSTMAALHVNDSVYPRWRYKVLLAASQTICRQWCKQCAFREIDWILPEKIKLFKDSHCFKPTSIPHPFPIPRQHPRWLPLHDGCPLCPAHVIDAGFQDGDLSRRSPHLLTPPHVPIPTPWYPRWLPVQDGCPWRKLLFKMAAYLTTLCTTPHACPHPRPAISKMAACPRWLHCTWMIPFIQDGSLSTVATSRRAHPRWLPVKDGCLSKMAADISLKSTNDLTNTLHTRPIKDATFAMEGFLQNQ